MAIKETFICDKCKKESPLNGDKRDKGTMTITVRLSYGHNENTHYNENTLQTTYCGSCIKSTGLDTLIKPATKKASGSVETIEDKIVFVLEELGFKRGD